MKMTVRLVVSAVLLLVTCAAPVLADGGGPIPTKPPRSLGVSGK